MGASTVGCGFKYEISEEFYWLNYVDEIYQASIATTDGTIIRITLDDFVQCYTSAQAAEVARCIFEALAAIKKARSDLPSLAKDAVKRNSYEDAFNHFAHDKLPTTKSPREKQVFMVSFAQRNYLYMAVGEFSDPDLTIELCDGEEAIYNMIVASETGDSLEMRFGMFSMHFTKEQALWLWFHLSIAANSLGQHHWVGAS